MTFGTYPGRAIPASMEKLLASSESYLDLMESGLQVYTRESIPRNELASLCDKALETKDNSERQTW